MFETNRLEWKREFTEDIKKELVAFANTQGGELIIGLADDGTVIGVTNPDQVSAQVTNMIRETDGYSYESNLSFEQNLTFEYCRKVFADKGIRFGQNQMQTMKLLTPDGIYTNLGLLLSDQCFHSIQLACFQGAEIGTFTDRQRFSGSILKQLDEAFAVMNHYNRTRSEIHGLHRVDSRDFPETVLREALINAIVHRDYDRDVSTNIRIFADRIEIASFGGLPPNTTIETFLLGLSIPRNRNLADIFYRLQLIEAFGSGIPKMINLYRESGQEIQFKTSPSGFLIILPNLNYSKELLPAGLDQTTSRTETLSMREQRIKLALDLIQQRGLVSRSDLETVWNLSRSSATMWIENLVQAGILIRQGSGRNTRYGKGELATPRGL